jgi:glycerol-3-phosphate dehydrogenase
VPDGERVLVGTHHLALDRPPAPEDRPQVPEAAIAQMLTALNRAMPALALTMADVGGVRAGFLPAERPGASAMAKRPVILDHGIEGGPEGLISVSGVKWTTARLVAAEVIAGVVARRARAAAA